MSQRTDALDAHRCDIEWGSIAMVETTQRIRSENPVNNDFGRSRDDSQFAPKRGARFRAAKFNLESEGSLPLFLVGRTGDPTPTQSRKAWDKPSTVDAENAWQQDFRATGGRTSPVSRGVITTGILAASAVVIACVALSLQDRDRRAVIAHASASLSAAQLEPIDQPAPTREAISAAFKAAVQNQSDIHQPAQPR